MIFVPSEHAPLPFYDPASGGPAGVPIAVQRVLIAALAVTLLYTAHLLSPGPLADVTGAIVGVASQPQALARWDPEACRPVEGALELHWTVVGSDGVTWARSMRVGPGDAASGSLTSDPWSAEIYETPLRYAITETGCTAP